VSSPPSLDISCSLYRHKLQGEGRNPLLIEADPLSFCESLLEYLPQRRASPWSLQWKEKQSTCYREKTPPPFPGEEGVIEAMSCHLKEEVACFIGNSLPIRAAQATYAPSRPLGPLFGNRGLSGIDGNISTAIGISQARKGPVALFIGDLTFLHDLNALAALSSSPYPLLLLVYNNGGGAIFSRLPIAESPHPWKPYFMTPHTFLFAQAASLFHLDYQEISDREALNAAISSWGSHHLMLEIKA
ncbi:MAG: thiamine pyrophosphate-binding protein, partial [Chlamydiota bacterium]|nr:thiamine pyrophosphate-binding protein [Chlamydiota bacterium]